MRRTREGEDTEAQRRISGRREMEAPGQGRIPSFEVLRVGAMLMVICLHFNYQSGSLAGESMPLTPARVMGGITESLAIVAVNVYVLISGYFLCEAPFKAERVVKLILQTLFYALLIPLILSAAGIDIYGRGIWNAVFYFLPVSMNHYWFVTGYVAMYLFSPVLNSAAARLTRGQLKIVILGLLFFASFLKSISPVKLNIDQAGYDFGWFLILYLIAAYIRHYGAGRIGTGKRAGRIYLFCSAGTFFLYLVLHLVYERTGKLSWYMQVPFHYNAVLVLVGSVGLFQFFRGLDLQSGKLVKLLVKTAPYTFGVYLIHQHIDIRNRWIILTGLLTGEVLQDNPLLYLVQMLVSVFLVFAVCALIDWVRAKIFVFAGRLLSKRRGKAFLSRIDAAFAKAPGEENKKER